MTGEPGQERVYRTLGNVPNGGEALGNHDFYGWYKTSANPDNGEYTELGRPWLLDGDYTGLDAKVDRTLYGTITYADPDAVEWQPFQWESSDNGRSRDWEGEGTPMPDYESLTAFAPFADIDLADDLKAQRGTDAVPRAAIETALGHYRDEFSELAGDSNAVFMLDSVGGAYAFLAPTTTAPIADAFDGTDRGRVFEELAGRLNDWLSEAGARVTDAVPAVEGVFEPDLVNNKNRLYKAPLTKHKSIDGVVTPIDPASPRYALTHPRGAGDGLLADAQQWAREFTDGKHARCIDSIVETLFDDYYEGDWQTALAEWLEDEREEEIAKTHSQALREYRRQKESTTAGEMDVAAELGDIFDAIADVTPADIRLRSEKTEDDGNRMSFDPSWEHSASGTRLGFDDGWIYRATNTGMDALQVVALEEGIIASPQDYPSGREFFDAVEELRNRGGDIPEPPEEEHDPTPQSTVDLKGLTSLSAAERRRAARKRDLDWPSTDDARTMLRDRSLEAMENEENVIIDAPTALGKSYTVATEPWLDHGDGVTGNQPVVHLHATKDARTEAAEASRDAGIDVSELKGREDLCPLASGAHNPKGDEETITADGAVPTEFIRKMCNGKGMPYSVVHQFIEDNNDQGATPACCKNDIECATQTQWNGVPRDSDTDEPVADVIHATHQFARVPGLTRSTNVVFDERPDFAADLSTDDVQRHVTAFLKEVDAPSKTWSQFVRDATFSPETWDDVSTDAMQEIDEMWDALDSEPDRDWYFEEPDAHTMAPGLAKALWNAFRSDEDANGRRIGKAPFEPPRLDAQASDDEGWNRVWVTVVINEDERIETVRETPGLSLARSVIGLDAHPAEHVWQVNTLPYMEIDELLTHEQRRLWRQFERGLTVVQVGDATRPLTTGEYFGETGLRTFMSHLRDEFGDDFSTAITSSAVEGKMRRVMNDVGIPVTRDNTMHFGEEKSRNDFGDEEIGVVNGCIDPGDDYVANLLAECGLDAEPATTAEGDREHGRTFAGPDADAAEQILASVREQHVAQAAGRYARNADDPDDMATVFVRTDAIPDGFADVKVPGVTWTTTETQRAIIEYIQQAGRATAKEIKGAVGCSKRHAAKTLQRLAEDGTVSAREKAGENGATLFYDRNASSDGTADLRIANRGVWDTYTWAFAVDPPKVARSGEGEDDGGSSTRSKPIPDAIEDPPDDDQQTLGLVADD